MVFLYFEKTSSTNLLNSDSWYHLPLMSWLWHLCMNSIPWMRKKVEDRFNLLYMVCSKLIYKGMSFTTVNILSKTKAIIGLLQLALTLADAHANDYAPGVKLVWGAYQLLHIGPQQLMTKLLIQSLLLNHCLFLQTLNCLCGWRRVRQMRHIMCVWRYWSRQSM